MCSPSVEEIILKYLTESKFHSLTSSSSSSSSAGSLFSSESESAAACSDNDFYQHFHINQTLAQKLIKQFSKSDTIPQVHGKEKIPSEKVFLVFLWYLRTNEPFRVISRQFGLAYSTAWRCIRRVVNHLLTLQVDVVRWPNERRFKEIKLGFKIKAKFDSIGVIDICHIGIRKPNKLHEQYESNGKHSILLIAVCDHETRFIELSCGHPGSSDPSVVLKSSDLYNKMCSNRIMVREGYLLGPSYFPNLLWLITPFSNNKLSETELLFNSEHEKACAVAKTAFDALKGRFCRIKKVENHDLKFASEVVLAACILHNMCIDHGDVWSTTNDADESEVKTAVLNLQNIDGD